MTFSIVGFDCDAAIFLVFGARSSEKRVAPIPNDAGPGETEEGWALETSDHNENRLWRRLEREKRILRIGI